MNLSVRTRLSMMMVLIYAVQGSFMPLLALHLGDLGITGRERGWIFTTYPIAAIVMSLGAGAFVDRLMPSQRYLSLCFGLGAALLFALAMGWPASFLAILGLYLIYWLVIAPTYGIANSLAFRNLPAPDTDFGRVRMWGTVGWMVVGWLVSIVMAYSGSIRSGQGAYEAFLIGSMLSAIVAVFALFLPNTPPLATQRAGPSFGLTMTLLKIPSVGIYLITAFFVSLTTPFVYQAMPPYLESIGLARSWVATVMTLGQWPEILALVGLPLLLRRFGFKLTLGVGMVAWLIRFASLAMHPPAWVAIAGIPLHGIGIACFTVGGQIFLDSRAPRDRRASAQALNMTVSTGLGALFGSLLAGELQTHFVDNYSAIFLVPCLIQVGLIIFFILGFRPDIGRTTRVAVVVPVLPAAVVSAFGRRVRSPLVWGHLRWSRPMGDYLRLLTVSDRAIPLVDLQRAAMSGAVWSVDHPGMLGNYLAIGPKLNENQEIWATVERNPVGPNTLGAEEVAEFIDSLEAGGPPSAVRWLADYLESVRAIYAIRIYPESVGGGKR